jgi:hypothetical protein
MDKGRRVASPLGPATQGSSYSSLGERSGCMWLQDYGCLGTPEIGVEFTWDLGCPPFRCRWLQPHSISSHHLLSRQYKMRHDRDELQWPVSALPWRSAEQITLDKISARGSFAFCPKLNCWAGQLRSIRTASSHKLLLLVIWQEAQRKEEKVIITPRLFPRGTSPKRSWKEDLISIGCKNPCLPAQVTTLVDTFSFSLRHFGCTCLVCLYVCVCAVFKIFFLPPLNTYFFYFVSTCLPFL